MSVTRELQRRLRAEFAAEWSVAAPSAGPTPKGKGRMMTRTLIVVVALIATSTGAGIAQDVAKGEASFKKCLICHSIGPGAQNKVGPEQNGLDGRKAGSVPNYQYSDANKNSGLGLPAQ
jgi:cytochrome c2